MEKKYKLIPYLVVLMLATQIGFGLALKDPIFQNMAQYFLARVLLEPETIQSNRIVGLTNESRESFELLPLKVSEALTRAAQNKAENMLDLQYFSHVSPDGKKPWDWMKEAGYRYLYAGENLAVYFTTSESLVDAWLRSPTHRQNITGRQFTEIGVGVARGEFKEFKTAIVVALFGNPLGEPGKIVKKKFKSAYRR